MKDSEAKIAERVVRWLEDAGHDVYQEVEIPGGVADIVTIIGPEVWIVEVKRTYSFELVRQLEARRSHAHRVYAATPPSKSDGPWLASQLGIGTLEVGRDEVRIRWAAPRVSSDPRFGRRLRGLLRPEHKTSAMAGAPSAAGRHTEFRGTCAEVLTRVSACPGETIKELVDGISHHYSSASAARATLAKRITQGLVPGVELRKDDDGRLRVWPTERSKG